MESIKHMNIGSVLRYINHIFLFLSCHLECSVFNPNYLVLTSVAMKRNGYNPTLYFQMQFPLINTQVTLKNSPDVLKLLSVKEESI